MKEQLEPKYVYKNFKWRLAPIKRTQPKINRNSKCPCGSGLKLKKCCINKKD